MDYLTKEQRYKNTAIHNQAPNLAPQLDYGIKFKLVYGSTLINSNKTNFIYKIQGISAKQMAVFNSLDKFKEKFDYLKYIGASISYHKTANNVLHNNLTMLDLGIERIIADCLLDYYSGNGQTLVEITENISKADPLHLLGDTDQPMYAYKIKQFLLAFALEVTPSKLWNGGFHTNGRCLIVKEDGNIIYDLFFDRNNLEDYLFFNTHFETPSISQQSFGDIYQENSEYFLTLNLQVRFR